MTYPHELLRCPGNMKSIVNKLVLLFVLACTSSLSFAEDGDGVGYRVRIRGARDRAVKKAIKESTTTCKLRKRPPSTIGQLQRRIENDVPTIKAILESRGYYDGTVATAVDPARSPVRVTLDVDMGEQYRFRKVELRFAGEPDPELEKIKTLVRRKARVVAVSVFQEQQRILDIIKRRGYPFPKLVKRSVEVDRENKVVDLVLVFDPGTLAYFGKVQVEGLDRLPSRYLTRQVPWDWGDKYDHKKVADFEKKLLETGLFGSVRVDPSAAIAQTNSIPISIRVSERNQRTVRLGVNYSDIGPGAKAYWEHRNFFGGGERLETSLSWNPIKTGAEASLTRMGFLDANQSLKLEVDASVDRPDAYDARQTTVAAMVLRDFTSSIQGGIGVGYKHSRIEQFDAYERHGLLFFPLQAIVDTRNDKLNPVGGAQWFGRTAYFEDMIGFHSFLKSQMEARHYYMLWESFRLSSALRLTLGSIDGTAVESVPADERFYAGGGGSVRGYEYQSIGPRIGDTPAGGDKHVEFSAELRLQPGPRLGYAVFVDGGTVYNDELDDGWNRSLRYGAGVGLRWFTTIGPLRADLAYPINPDDSQVERVQFYISLGQAF